MSETLTCRCCDTPIRPEANAGAEDFSLCESYYDRHYTRCSHCGTLLLENHTCYYSPDDDDELSYCSDCYRLVNRKDIRDYYYKPTPRFFGDPPRYYGVEPEIDGGGESSYKARQLLDLANTEDELIYIKRDGSLDEGLEIVTYPMSLDYHRSRIPWEALMRKASSSFGLLFLFYKIPGFHQQKGTHNDV